MKYPLELDANGVAMSGLDGAGAPEPAGAPGPGAPVEIPAVDYTTLYPDEPADPSLTHPELAAELVAMTAEDHALQRGALTGTFEEQLAWRRVTVRNGDRLMKILQEHGWPVEAEVGTEGARCAWLIAQHADHQLDVQRRALELLERAAADGRVHPRQVAFLRDRVLVNEGRPQIYGTQIAGVQDGAPIPWPCEDPAHLDERRAEVGLEPFAEHTGRFAAQ